jgi:hypothetical protein
LREDVQEPLPAVVTVPHSHGPEPTNRWLAIGSKVAVTSDGLTVIRFAEKGVQFMAQLTFDPESVYWESGHPTPVVQVMTALSQAELPAFVQ